MEDSIGGTGTGIAHLQSRISSMEDKTITQGESHQLLLLLLLIRKELSAVSYCFIISLALACEQREKSSR